MFASEFDRIDRKNAEDRHGVRFSAVLLTLLSIPCGMCALLLAFLFFAGVGIHGSQRYASPRESLGLYALLFIILASLATFCVWAGRALLKGKRWAANVATAFGLLLLWLSAEIVYDWFHPHKASADEYFDIFLVPLTTLTGLWWCIYLNWPSVRASFRNRLTDNKEA